MQDILSWEESRSYKQLPILLFCYFTILPFGAVSQPVEFLTLRGFRLPPETVFIVINGEEVLLAPYMHYLNLVGRGQGCG